MPAEQVSMIERLTAVAVAARALMEEARSDPQDRMFEDFPRGCCGPTCELLGRYLVERLSIDAKYICAGRNGERGYISHAWLVVEDIIIDITADQFGQAPVIVSRQSDWHAEWTPEEPRAPICTHEQWSMYPFRAWYALSQGLQAKGLV